MTEEKAVAKPEPVALATTNLPEGFENVQADEFAKPVIKLWSKMTKAEVEGGKLGEYYDVASAKTIGQTFAFRLLAIRTGVFQSDDGDKQYKQLLIVPKGETMPKILSLSVSSFRASENLMTTLLAESQHLGGAPIYAMEVIASSDVRENDKGKFAVAIFTVDGETNRDDLDMLSTLYEQHGKTFNAVRVEEAMAE